MYCRHLGSIVHMSRSQFCKYYADERSRGNWQCGKVCLACIKTIILDRSNLQFTNVTKTAIHIADNISEHTTYFLADDGNRCPIEHSINDSMSLSKQISSDVRGRKRRKRTIITAEQLEKLEHTFKQEQWPNKMCKERVAYELGSNEQFVSIWFQNKRARVKREEEMAKLQVTEKCLAIMGTPKNAGDDREELNAITTRGVAIIREQPDGSDVVTTSSSELFENYEYEDVPSAFVIPQSFVTDIKPSISQEDNASVDVTTSSSEPNMLASSNFYLSSPAPGPGYSSKVGNKVVPRNTLPCSDGKLSLFRAIINMIAVTEGGILDKSHPEFPTATTDALYGIYINRDSRLVYDRVYGLEFVDFD